MQIYTPGYFFQRGGYKMKSRINYQKTFGTSETNQNANEKQEKDVKVDKDASRRAKKILAAATMMSMMGGCEYSGKNDEK